MQDQFHLFNILAALGGSAPGPVRTATGRLKAEEFKPGTIFINTVSAAAQPGPLLQFRLEGMARTAVAAPQSCLLPSFALAEAGTMVPEEFSGKGVPLALLCAPGISSGSRPAIEEFPGNRFVVNFDFRALLVLILNEKYLVHRRPFYTHFPGNIQRIPPEWRQVAGRFLHRGKREPAAGPVFPAFPKDGAADLLLFTLYYLLKRVTGRDLPLAIWPDGKKYAFILTHDVDSGWVYRDGNLEAFSGLEKKHGIRGAWYFVANLYPHDHAKIAALRAEGHEIGLHGDNHDHKIAFLSEKDMRQRLDGCRWFIEKYGVTGYRAPVFLRTPAFYEVLKDYVRYDTSMHDTAESFAHPPHFREGCSTVYPFAMEQGLLQLPVTIREDFRIFSEGDTAASISDLQLGQIEEIKKRNGLATLLVHPEGHFTARKPCLEALDTVLASVAVDPDCWLCTPEEIYRYWLEVTGAPAAV